MPRTAVSATSTHAIRNPGKPVQQVRCQPTASGAAKATAALQKEEARLQRRTYEQEIEVFNEHRDREITRIANKFDKTNKYVRGVLCHKSVFKTARAKNLRNAIKHDRALKAKAAGETKCLEDYHDDLQDEIDTGAVLDEESLGKVEYERLMNQLEEKRQTECRRARATNKAAANDARKTSMSIGDQLTNLYKHTRVRGFAIFSQGHADDDSLLQAVDSDNALEFFLQEMGTDQLDVLRKFEYYSCTMDEATRKNNAKSVRADMSRRLTKGLCKHLHFSPIVQRLTFPLEMILRNTKVVMEYSKYDVVIRGGSRRGDGGLAQGRPYRASGDHERRDCAAYPPHDPRGGDPLGVDVKGSAGSAHQGAGRAACGVGRDIAEAQGEERQGDNLRTVPAGAGSGLPVPIPSLSHSPSVLDQNVSHPPAPSTATTTPIATDDPPAPSTAATTPIAADTAPAPTPDLDLTDLLHMPEDGLGPDLNFNLDFLQISNDMAAAFPNMAGMEPFAPGSYGDAGGPSSAVYAPDLVLTPLDVNTGSKRTAAHLEEINSGAPAKKQRKKRCDAGIARGPRK
ncbi:hypothetical protein B0H14DRAFT_2613727 [Mycena olivaceomarginata]|nr:hypothetical protein B0H14DRAFT_2613727 [Mycena olivaceomarginata]